MKSGNQYEMFMYVPLGALTTQTTEGTVGSSLSINVLNTTATIGEYADYANFSSLSLATSIDNTVENVAKEMSYQLGESLSALVVRPLMVRTASIPAFSWNWPLPAEPASPLCR